MSGPIRPIHEGSNSHEMNGLSGDVNIDRERARAVVAGLEALLTQILERSPATNPVNTLINHEANTVTVFLKRPEGRTRSHESPFEFEFGAPREMNESFNELITKILQKHDEGKFIYNTKAQLLPSKEGEQKLAAFVIDNKRKEVNGVEDIIVAIDEAFALGELNQKKKELEEVNAAKQKVTGEIHTQTANPADKLQQASRLHQQRLEQLNKQEEALRADIQRLEEKRDTAKLEKTYYEKT